MTGSAVLLQNPLNLASGGSLPVCMSLVSVNKDKEMMKLLKASTG